MTVRNTQPQNGSPVPMTCEEFQEQLPDYFAAGEGAIPADSPWRRHLETCEICSALVRDLQYIADQASLLLKPVEEEPSDDVWKKIQESIDHERDHPDEDHLAQPVQRQAALKGQS